MKEISITLPGGQTRTASYGTRVSELLSEEIATELPFPPIAALVNNELTSLSFKVEINSEVKPITVETGEGLRVYRNSLCFLLSMAAKDLYPDLRLVIGHSLGNGYFYYFEGEKEADETVCRSLEKRMRELVSEEIDIVRRVVSYEEALELFKRTNQPDTVVLLEQRNQNKVPVYMCREYTDLAHIPLAPNTTMLKSFEILNYSNGFILRYPPSRSPMKLAPFKDSPLLYSVYKEYKAWGKILGLHSVGRLNEVIYRGEIKDFIRVAETLHEKKIAAIADRIHEQRDELKVILIAGPSSSGKTTFTKKLAINLRVVGFNPVIISLDDYFLPRHLTPKDEDGNYDFEVLDAIDVNLLNEHLLELFEENLVEIPEFDFKTGERNEHGHLLRLDERSILLMEGIHGLNDNLTPRIPPETKYKIYVSALTQLNLDDHNRISTTDNRLLRRMVRDYKFRGYSALETLERWPSVRRGENRNIFPFQDNADTAFNSALDYELAVLKVYAEPLLKVVKPYHHHYTEAVRLLSFIDNFTALPDTHIPDFSILREFIGESGFKY
jgi:uridine kinase